MPDNELNYLDLTGLTRFKGKIQDILDTKVDKENGKYIVTVDSAMSSSSTNPVQNKVVKAYVDEHDSAAETVTFTSGDNTNPSAWTNVDAITTGETHASLFNKLSTMVKDVRFLNKDVLHIGYTNETTIQNGDDLNNFTTAGTYRCYSAATAATLLHCPASNTDTKSGFRLYVMPTGYGVNPIQYAMQLLIGGAAADGLGRIYYRFQKGSVDALYWDEWQTNYTSAYTEHNRKTLTSPDLLDKTIRPGSYYVTNATNVPSGVSVNGYYDVEIREFYGATLRVITYYAYDAAATIFKNRLDATTRNWTGWVKMPTRSEIDTLNTDLMPLVTRDWQLNVDLNDFKTTGTYFIGYNITNAPDGTSPWASLIVQSRGDTVRQYVTKKDGTIYVRVFQDSEWKPWTKMPTRAEIDQLNTDVIKKGANVTYATINANPSNNQYIQIQAESALGQYLLYVTDSGISLYDVNNNTVLHRVIWTS